MYPGYRDTDYRLFNRDTAMDILMYKIHDTDIYYIASRIQGYKGVMFDTDTARDILRYSIHDTGIY